MFTVLAKTMKLCDGTMRMMDDDHQNDDSETSLQSTQLTEGAAMAELMQDAQDPYGKWAYSCKITPMWVGIYIVFSSI